PRGGHEVRPDAGDRPRRADGPPLSRGERRGSRRRAPGAAARPRPATGDGRARTGGRALPVRRGRHGAQARGAVRGGRPPMKVLSVSYNGLGEPLGRSQVLPYVRGLADKGHSFTIVSFEKERSATTLAPADVHALLPAGTRWIPLRYHRRPTVP